MTWHPDIFARRLPNLEKRMELIRAVRSFFDVQDFYEVETSALQHAPGMDRHIHAFKTERLGLDLKHAETLYLHTSPEFAMKKLLVAGVSRLYQICKTFRNAEESRMHSPEFTMIEWYRAHSNEEAIREDCIGLLRHCAEKLGITHYKHGDREADPFQDWQILSVCEAIQHYADFDLDPFLPFPEEGRTEKTAAFRAALSAKNIHTAEDDNWDDLFFRVMGDFVEPHLGSPAPTLIYDYPSCMASLARQRDDDPRLCERFELYVCGVELANAFGELTDPAEQRRRFHEEMDLKEDLYEDRWPVDEDFLAAIEHGMPESGGIALGIDRLAMLACGAEDIREVLWV